MWQKDPTASPADAAQGNDYLYGKYTRATLTPLAAIGDAAMVGAVVGAALGVGMLVETCREGAQNGGRVY